MEHYVNGVEAAECISPSRISSHFVSLLNSGKTDASSSMQTREFEKELICKLEKLFNETQKQKNQTNLALTLLAISLASCLFLHILSIDDY